MSDDSEYSTSSQGGGSIANHSDGLKIQADELDERVLAATGGTSQRMMQGCFESEGIFHAYAPMNVQKPVAFGNYKTNPETWFFLAEFYDMLDKVPEPSQFVPLIANIHKASMGKSPNGKHGFQVPTHLANIPNDNTWQDTWEVFFTQLMKKMFEQEELAHGKDDRVEYLKEALYEKVIPRLLRPLETEGRSIQPCLIHSDIWPGNLKLDVETKKVILFDSCAFWGHNEADLGTWRAPRYRMGRPFFREYQRAMQISEPQEDWNDRNALYALRYDLLVSALFPDDGGLKFRDLAMVELERLVAKYPEGYDGYHSTRTATLLSGKTEVETLPSSTVEEVLVK
ncbi:Protein-ribulosamine 3-kinase, chloroplastic [Cytospora mali]|uniref:protein-ribulosamine 3-kinase n=1 Tax=Cytospora mali TaxID=578113 RepID=A0A194UNF3_CYTMA|nr:Protein-ribulosamine 3-kinase, chloroplastic [Valsa mali var. pyri (nom. inval.)]